MKQLFLTGIFIRAFICCVTAQPINTTRAQAIAERIWLTTDQKGGCPKVVFDNVERLAICSAPPNNYIVIDPNRVINQLMRLGVSSETALAIIIGHEIRHIQKKQSLYFGQFGSKGEYKEYELEADLYGICAAYFAGYSDALQVFDTIFSVLPIPISDDYPDIIERKQCNDRLLNEAGELFHIFETGQLLLVSAQQKDVFNYVYARLCYQYVQSKLVSTPEINFNIGLSYFLEALAVRDADRYLFPLECSEFPALQRLGGTKYLQGGQQLDSANYYFKIASRQIPADASKNLPGISALQPRLGLCSVALLKDIGTGLTLLDRVDADFPGQPEAQLLRAIAYAMRSQTTHNQQDSMISNTLLLQLADNQDAAIRQQALFNLRVLRENTKVQSPPRNHCSPPISNGIRNLDDLSLLMQDRANTGTPLQANKYFYSFPKAAVYLMEEWKGPESNHTQRAFQKMAHCDCLPDPANDWNGRPGKYRYLPDEKGKNGIIVHADASHPDAPTCYRVFR